MKTKILIGFLIIIVLLSGCGEKECKTAADCLEKTCFTAACRENSCAYSPVPDCCGNERCDQSEAYESCALDCPDCDDKNDCTIDEYNYNKQECVNTPILDRVCCGNGRCETEESYESCSLDCPNCNDDNDCTKDWYDYHTQECTNDVITPCCGNEICEEGVEEYSSCSADCPDCNDGNKLTTDTFNYADHECENPVTHYFFDDFEKGTQNWDFPEPTAWNTIVEEGNTVLRGTGNWANLQGMEWDNYILKFRFKRVKGSLGVNFRLFNSETGISRYIVYLSPEVVSFEKRGGAPGESVPTVNFKLGENWRTLEIRGYDNIFNVYIDNELLIKHKDTEYHIPSGRVAFESGDDSEFLFDDIEIKLITEEDVSYP